jgi:hypothetical protein
MDINAWGKTIYGNRPPSRGSSPLTTPQLERTGSDLDEEYKRDCEKYFRLYRASLIKIEQLNREIQILRSQLPPPPPHDGGKGKYKQSRKCKGARKYKQSRKHKLDYQS